MEQLPESDSDNYCDIVCHKNKLNPELNYFLQRKSEYILFFISTLQLILDSNSVFRYILPHKWNNNQFIFQFVIQIPSGGQKLLCLGW